MPLALQTSPSARHHCGCGSLYRDDPAFAAPPVEALTSEEAANLSTMREEEKVARDVYLRLFDRWGLRPFGNISGSEQTHMDMLLILLDRYGLPDPVRRLDAGVFQSPTMQKLHDTLVARGLQSESEAICVGLLIEELDIADLQHAAQHTNKPDILMVFARLERGSRNHLRAFHRWMRGLGAHYVPIHLSQATFSAIAHSGHEPCG
ncbi:MAG TPA: DUF2202 domain-containing protein [Acidocella sp.]|nr:MAG: hypothetical protein B7Z77_01865 [Acidocella sp. 20-58-15]HQT39984.1 DUF2202 domain-containing protein [Acidocella sp.]